jgi:hypothetical protein
VTILLPIVMLSWWEQEAAEKRTDEASINKVHSSLF